MLILITDARLCLFTAAPMNNLNDPPRWNIRPDNRGREAGAGDGNPWNYALLVPMLGLAAFRKFASLLSFKRENNIKRLTLMKIVCFLACFVVFFLLWRKIIKLKIVFVSIYLSKSM